MGELHWNFLLRASNAIDTKVTECLRTDCNKRGCNKKISVAVSFLGSLVRTPIRIEILVFFVFCVLFR